MTEENTTKLSQPSENPVKKSNKKIGVLGIASATIVIFLIVIMILLLKRNDKPEIISLGSHSTLVTKENVDEVEDNIEKISADNSYRAIMSVDWTFENGTAKSADAYVENSITNSRTVNFDVHLSSTNELIYSSPYLPLGSKLNNITLIKDLDAGDYPALVTYYLVDDDQNVISNVSLAITVHVLN